MIPSWVSDCRRRARFTVPFGLSLAMLAGSSWAAPGGGTLDISAGSIFPVQAITGGTLVGDKPVFVRAVIESTGTIPGGTEIDGVLRVIVDGVEAPYSPVYSDNGPIPIPVTTNFVNQNDTLNFIFVPPTSDDVVLTVELNPSGPGQVCETNYSNNINSTGTLNFRCSRRPDCVYVPIDYRPGGGGGPNLPNGDLIRPGVGDNFVQGMYPSGTWDYRRSEAPSKLWTGNLNGTGSALNASLLVDLQMTVPQPDFIYGWVPGGLPYNGQANGIPGQAGMGNTQQIRHQRTFAHELGHLFGRSHISNNLNNIGIDVEHHLNFTQGLPQLKVPTLSDVMVPGLLTNQAWTYFPNYEFYVAHPVFQCGVEKALPSANPNLLIAGLWNRETGEVTLTDTVSFTGGTPTESVPLSEADLILSLAEGGSQQLFGLAVTTDVESCSDIHDWPGKVDMGSFLIVLPDEVVPGTVESLEVIEAVSGTVRARLDRSSSAPEVALLDPESLVGDQHTLQWVARDSDGSSLKHYVRYSPDGERIVPLVANMTGDRFSVDMTEVGAFVEGRGYFELLTTDGLNTTVVRTDPLFRSAEAAGGNAPTTFVYTPDTGNSYPFGATVVLHASGWDIEDLSLDGGSLVWTSDVDGMIGTGRMTSVNDLSVGTHVLTVTATDSSLMTASSSTTITITSRDLPDFCQLNVGFVGPGTSLLEVCGTLGTGSTATVRLTGAAPNTTVYVVSGGSSLPTPVLGGLLVPVPVDNIFADATDANGTWTLAGGLVGGGGPGTLYIQTVYLDLSLPTNFGFSNAVRAEFLP